MVLLLHKTIMKDRKKKVLHLIPPLTWSSWFCYTIIVLFFSGFTFSSIRLFFPDGFNPRVSSLRGASPSMRIIISDELTVSFPVIIQETVIFPDQAMIFLKYPLSSVLYTKNDIDCVYLSTNDTSSSQVSPISVDNNYFSRQIIRCPLPPRGMNVSVAVKTSGSLPGGVPMMTWDSLAYEALIDHDNTTIVFVKGLNLRGGKTADPSRFKCVYMDSRSPNLLLRSDAISVAQEIVRCMTPLSILSTSQRVIDEFVKVSVRMIGKKTFDSISQPKRRFQSELAFRKQHKMCVCTMLRNQARFLHEWVAYHGQIGVQRWFIYDNNSDDDIENVIESLDTSNYNITRHLWPWVKTQEAGFAHCALRARDTCEWVGFIDVDEFFHLPSGLSLHDVLRNKSESNIGAIRTPCRSFGPSGLKHVPVQGVTIGYTCRMRDFERHKSIVKPEALNSTLINVVHHFNLKTGYTSVTMDKDVMVINHYKYQVWEVFKEKFYRRVATYVSDWQQDKNVGSKDRAPGLGTKAIEPIDWSTRFCEVKDTSLQKYVSETFINSETGLLPWQNQTNREL